MMRVHRICSAKRSRNVNDKKRTVWTKPFKITIHN